MLTMRFLPLFQDIDEYICQAKDKSYDTLVHFGRKGLNVAATAAVMAATKVMQTLVFVLYWPGHCRYGCQACPIFSFSLGDVGLLDNVC